MREVGAISELAPAFPTAGGALAPLKAKAEAQSSGDFSSLWSGQAASLARETDTASLTRKLADDGAAALRKLAGR
jgi:nitronate monooxygenase